MVSAIFPVFNRSTPFVTMLQIIDNKQYMENLIIFDRKERL